MFNERSPNKMHQHFSSFSNNSIGSCKNSFHSTASRLPPYPYPPPTPSSFPPPSNRSVSHMNNVVTTNTPQKRDADLGWQGNMKTAPYPYNTYQSFCLECFVEVLRESRNEVVVSSESAPGRKPLFLSECIACIERVHQLLCDTLLEPLFSINLHSPELPLMSGEGEPYSAVNAYRLYCATTMGWYTTTAGRIFPYLEELLFLCASQLEEDFEPNEQERVNDDSPYYLLCMKKKVPPSECQRGTAFASGGTRNASSGVPFTNPNFLHSGSDSESESGNGDFVQRSDKSNPILWCKWQKSIHNFIKLLFLIMENSCRCDKLKQCLVVEGLTDFIEFETLIHGKNGTRESDNILKAEPCKNIFGDLIGHMQQMVSDSLVELSTFSTSDSENAQSKLPKHPLKTKNATIVGQCGSGGGSELEEQWSGSPHHISLYGAQNVEDSPRKLSCGVEELKGENTMSEGETQIEDGDDQRKIQKGIAFSSDNENRSTSDYVGRCFNAMFSLRTMRLVEVVTGLLKDTGTSLVFSNEGGETSAPTDVRLPIILFQSFETVIGGLRKSDFEGDDVASDRFDNHKTLEALGPTELWCGFQSSLAALPISGEALETYSNCFLCVSSIYQKILLPASKLHGAKKQQPFFCHVKERIMIISIHDNLLSGLYYLLSDALHPITLQKDEKEDSLKEEESKHSIAFQRECCTVEVCALLSKSARGSAFVGGASNDKANPTILPSLGASLVSALIFILQHNGQHTLTNSSSRDSRSVVEAACTWKGLKGRKQGGSRRNVLQEAKRTHTIIKKMRHRTGNTNGAVVFSSSSPSMSLPSPRFYTAYCVLKLLWSESDVFLTCLLLLAPPPPCVPEGSLNNPFFRPEAVFSSSSEAPKTADTLSHHHNSHVAFPSPFQDATCVGALCNDREAENGEHACCDGTEEENQHSQSIRVFCQVVLLLPQLLPLIWSSLPSLCSMEPLLPTITASLCGTTARCSNCPSPRDIEDRKQDHTPSRCSLSYSQADDVSEEKRTENSSILLLDLISLLVCSAQSEIQELDEWCDKYIEWWRRSLEKEHFQRLAESVSRQRATDEKRHRKHVEKMNLLKELHEDSLVENDGEHVQGETIFLLGADEEEKEGDSFSSFTSEEGSFIRVPFSSTKSPLSQSGADTNDVHILNGKNDATLQDAANVTPSNSTLHFPPPLHIATYRHMLLQSFDVVQSSIQTLESFVNQAYQFIHDLPESKGVDQRAECNDSRFETSGETTKETKTNDRLPKVDRECTVKDSEPLGITKNQPEQESIVDNVKYQLQKFLRLLIQVLNEMTKVWKRLAKLIALQPLPRTYESCPFNEVEMDENPSRRVPTLKRESLPNVIPTDVQKSSKEGVVPAGIGSFSFSPSSVLKIQVLMDLFMLHVLYEDDSSSSEWVKDYYYYGSICSDSQAETCSWRRWETVFLGSYYTQRLRDKQRHSEVLEGGILSSSKSLMPLNELVYFLLDAMPIWRDDMEHFARTRCDLNVHSHPFSVSDHIPTCDGNGSKSSLEKELYFFLSPHLRCCRGWEIHPSLLPSVHGITLVYIKLLSSNSFLFLGGGHLHTLLDHHALQLLAETMEMLSCSSCVYSLLPFFAFLLRQPQLPPIPLNSSALPDEDVFWTAYCYREDPPSPRLLAPHLNAGTDLTRFNSLLLVWLSVLVTPECISPRMEESYQSTEDPSSVFPCYRISSLSSPALIFLSAAVLQEFILEHLNATLPEVVLRAIPQSANEEVREGETASSTLYKDSLCVESQKCTALLSLAASLLLYVGDNFPASQVQSDGIAVDKPSRWRTDVVNADKYSDSAKVYHRWVQEMISDFLFSSVTPASYSSISQEKDKFLSSDNVSEEGAIGYILSWSHSLQESLIESIVQDEVEDGYWNEDTFEEVNNEGYDKRSRRRNVSSLFSCNQRRQILKGLQDGRQMLLKSLFQLSFIFSPLCKSDHASRGNAGGWGNVSSSVYASRFMPFWVRHAVCIENLLDTPSSSILSSRTSVVSVHLYERAFLAYNISPFLLQCYFISPHHEILEHGIQTYYRCDGMRKQPCKQVTRRQKSQKERLLWLQSVFCRWILDCLDALADLPLPEEWSSDSVSSHVSHFLRYHLTETERHQEKHKETLVHFFNLFRTLLLSCACYIRATASLQLEPPKEQEKQCPYSKNEYYLSSLPVLSDIIASRTASDSSPKNSGFANKYEQERTIKVIRRAKKNLCFFLNQGCVHLLYEITDSSGSVHSFCPYAKEVSNFSSWWTQMREQDILSRRAHHDGDNTDLSEGQKSSPSVSVMDQLLVSLMGGTRRDTMHAPDEQNGTRNEMAAEDVSEEDWCSSWSAHLFVILLFSSSTTLGLSSLVKSLRERRTCRTTRLFSKTLKTHCNEGMEFCMRSEFKGVHESYDALGSCGDSSTEAEDLDEHRSDCVMDETNSSTLSEYSEQFDHPSDVFDYCGKSTWSLEVFEECLLANTSYEAAERSRGSDPITGPDPSVQDKDEHIPSRPSSPNTLFHSLLSILTQHFLMVRCVNSTKKPEPELCMSGSRGSFRDSLLNWELVNCDAGSDDEDEKSELESSMVDNMGIRECGSEVLSTASSLSTMPAEKLSDTRFSNIVITEDRRSTEAKSVSIPCLSGFHVWSNCIALIFRHTVHAHLCSTFNSCFFNGEEHLNGMISSISNDTDHLMHEELDEISQSSFTSLIASQDYNNPMQHCTEGNRSNSSNDSLHSEEVLKRPVIRKWKEKEVMRLKGAGTDVKHFVLLLLIRITQYTNSFFLLNRDEKNDALGHDRHLIPPFIWDQVLEKLFALPFRRLCVILSTYSDLANVRRVPPSLSAYIKESLRAMQESKQQKGGSTATYLLSCLLTHILFGLRFARLKLISSSPLFFAPTQIAQGELSDPVVSSSVSVKEVDNNSLNLSRKTQKESWAAWAWSWASSEFLAYFPSSSMCDEPVDYYCQHSNDSFRTKPRVSSLSQARSATSLHQLHLLWLLIIEGAPSSISSLSDPNDLHAMRSRRAELTLRNEMKKLKNVILPWLCEKRVSRYFKDDDTNEGETVHDEARCDPGVRIHVWSSLGYSISVIMAGIRLLSMKTLHRCIPASSATSAIQDALSFLVTVQLVGSAYFEHTASRSEENESGSKMARRNQEVDECQWETIRIRIKRYFQEWEIGASESLCGYHCAWTSSDLLFRSYSHTDLSPSISLHALNYVPLCQRLDLSSNADAYLKNSGPSVSLSSESNTEIKEGRWQEYFTYMRKDGVAKDGDRKNSMGQSLLQRIRATHGNFHSHHHIVLAFNSLGQELYSNLPQSVSQLSFWNLFPATYEQGRIGTSLNVLHGRTPNTSVELLRIIPHHFIASSSSTSESCKDCLNEVLGTSMFMHLPITIEESMFQSSLEELIRFLIYEADLNKMPGFMFTESVCIKNVETRFSRLLEVCSTARCVYNHMISFARLLSSRETLGHFWSETDECRSMDGTNPSYEEVGYSDAAAGKSNQHTFSLRLKMLEERMTSLYLFTHSQLQLLPSDGKRKMHMEASAEITCCGAYPANERRDRGVQISGEQNYPQGEDLDNSTIDLARQTVLCWLLAALLEVSNILDENQESPYKVEGHHFMASNRTDSKGHYMAIGLDASPLRSLYPGVLNMAKLFLSQTHFHNASGSEEGDGTSIFTSWIHHSPAFPKVQIAGAKRYRDTDEGCKGSHYSVRSESQRVIDGGYKGVKVEKKVNQIQRNVVHSFTGDETRYIHISRIVIQKMLLVAAIKLRQLVEA